MLAIVNRIRVTRRSETAFTLIELIVIIVVLGILALIALPLISNHQRSARDATLKSDLRNVAIATQSYFTKDARKINLDDPSLTGVNRWLSGWSVVRLGSPDARFDGTVLGAYPTSQVKPATYDNIKVSPGVGIGIISQHGWRPWHYCIVGNAVGSNYEPVSITNGKYGTLFWDSRVGGVIEKSRIPIDGACKDYR